MGNNRKKKKFTLNNRQRITIGVWLFVIGTLFLTNNYFMTKKQKAYETIGLSLSTTPTQIEAEEDVPDEIINDTKKDEVTKKDVFVNKPYYIGRLEIPKISLVKGFAAIGSPENHVDKNVAVMPASTYPDKERGNFVLAAHNGNCWNCYFRHLHSVGKGDLAYVFYKGNKYTYKVVSIYTQPITGKITIRRDITKTTMTLITCKSKTEQTVWILNLIKTEKA